MKIQNSGKGKGIGFAFGMFVLTYNIYNAAPAWSLTSGTERVLLYKYLPLVGDQTAALTG